MTKKTPKTMLVKAPDGFGYHLNRQVPQIYVSGRPHVVQNDSQVQIASSRNSLIILGETKMTDEEFLEAYKKDAKAAIAAAVLDNEKADPAAAQAAAKSASASKKKAAETKKAEAERIKAEAAKQKEADEAHAKAQAEAAKAQEGND